MEFRVPKLSGFPDMRQLTSDATTIFSRARQYTEEKLGSAEKTEYDANFENLQIRYDKTKQWTEKLKSEMEVALQPNPNTRMEDFVYMKLDRKPPERINNIERLGMTMIEAGNDFGPGTSYGGVLLKCGETQMKLGQAEQSFLQTTMQNYLLPLNNFLEGDCKTIQKERKTLEKKRLDLDACKNRLKKARSLEARQTAESELRIAQTDFDRQQEITRLLLEGVSSTQAHHSRSLNEFVDAQTEYFAKCYQYMKDLQEQLRNTEPSPIFSRAVSGGRSSVPLGNITGVTSATLSSSKKRARVLYDYDAADTTELSLLADEIILVYEAPGLVSDWMMGQRGTSSGKVPTSYLSILND
ncbi:endophilin-B1-like [Clavelina lepadiformis]|uniref:Endophilin-B1 n=1 Tax=Clavelina lepadiformis TaxID=159417 RepID=A0ABP0H3I8_CLALP